MLFVRRGYVLAGLMLFVALPLAGCQAGSGPGKPDSTPASPPMHSRPANGAATALRLPPGAFPRFLTFSRDGTLWITESGGAIARLDNAGQLQQHRIPGSENSPGDIVEGPDGAMWYAGFEQVGRLDSNGSFSRWTTASNQAQDVGLPAALVAGTDGGIWFTDESVPPRISRISTSGVITRAPIPSGEGGLKLTGITTGPDSALWFTQNPVSATDPPNAIGRMTIDGRYLSWRLPKPQSQPTRIVAGPDGALWFTERSGCRIGRMTTTGAISEFTLPSGVSPFDITAGSDKAIWFTTDTRIGRISTTGHIALWPVPGAKGLIGIAAATDGSFWLADGQADTVWHFVPP